MKRAHKGGGRLALLVAALLIVPFTIWFVWLVGAVNEPEPAFVAPAAPARARSPAAPREQKPVWPPLADGVAPVADLTASNYYVVLDGSGSMKRSDCAAGSTKMRVALQAMAPFIASIPANANLGLTVFDGSGLSERVPLGQNNRAQFGSALTRVDASGGTPLRSAIELAYDKLTKQAQRQLGYGEYHVVVVTDGRADPSSQDPTGVVQRMLAESPVVLHTIGFCIGEDHVLNQPGLTYYAAADSGEQLAQGLSGVLAESPSFDPGSFSAQ